MRRASSASSPTLSVSAGTITRWTRSLLLLVAEVDRQVRVGGQQVQPMFWCRHVLMMANVPA